MAYRIQFRRDTSTNWTNNNPILLQGEFGYETNTGYAKIGDGSTPWASLDYFGGTGPTGPIGPTGVTGSTGSTGPTGVTGPAGSSGTSGTSGTSGSNGTSGTSGSNGTSGTSGSSGTSGTSGSSGTSGTSGTDGTSGSSGSSGSSGTSGANGTSGTSGTDGTSGSSGSSGTSGTSGATGDAGLGLALFTLVDNSSGNLIFPTNNSIEKSGSGSSASKATTSESWPYNSSFVSGRLNVHVSNDMNIGLSTNGTLLTYALSFQSGDVYVYYNNSFIVSSVTTYTTNDFFEIVAQSSGVYMYKNGVQIYTNSLVGGTSSLKAIFNIYTQDDIIDQISTGYVKEGVSGTSGTSGTSGIGVIAGGATGQFLVKNSTTDYDTIWTSSVVSSIAPASSGASGATGQIALDSSNLYICIATDTWKRVALTTF